METEVTYKAIGAKFKNKRVTFVQCSDDMGIIQFKILKTIEQAERMVANPPISQYRGVVTTEIRITKESAIALCELIKLTYNI